MVARTSNLSIALASVPLLILAVLLSGCDTAPTSPEKYTFIFDDKISDESYRAWGFDLPSRGRNFKLRGWFVVTRGGSHDINAYVVDAEEYANFPYNFRASRALYSRQRVAVGRFDLLLDRGSGPYYFILSNRFSEIIDKRVEGEVTLTYDR